MISAVESQELRSARERVDFYRTAVQAAGSHAHKIVNRLSSITWQRVSGSKVEDIKRRELDALRSDVSACVSQVVTAGDWIKFHGRSASIGYGMFKNWYDAIVECGRVAAKRLDENSIDDAPWLAEFRDCSKILKEIDHSTSHIVKCIEYPLTKLIEQEMKQRTPRKPQKTVAAKPGTYNKKQLDAVALKKAEAELSERQRLAASGAADLAVSLACAWRSFLSSPNLNAAERAAFLCAADSCESLLRKLIR